MKIAIGSDERTHLTDVLLEELRRRGHDVVPFGPLAEADPDEDWPLVSRHVAEAVAADRADEGIVCCRTGPVPGPYAARHRPAAICREAKGPAGVPLSGRSYRSIAANKAAGIRAALCHDAETARGARVWNHANVLALSLRATSEAIAKEILDAWFDTPYSNDEWNCQQIARLRQMEERRA